MGSEPGSQSPRMLAVMQLLTSEKKFTEGLGKYTPLSLASPLPLEDRETPARPGPPTSGAKAAWELRSQHV